MKKCCALFLILGFSLLAGEAREEFDDVDPQVSKDSQAATHMANVSKLLSSSERSSISLFTFGGATIVPDIAFGKVTNYISKMDIISMSNPFQYLKASMGFGSNVEFLAPTSTNPFAEHFFMGNTYGGKIANLGEEFIERHYVK